MSDTKLTTDDIRSNDLLEHLADETNYNTNTPVPNTELDKVLRSANAELTPPLRFNVSSANSRLVEVDPIQVVNPETGNIRTITPIDGQVPDFSGGTVEIPATNGDNIVITPGASVPLTITSGLFRKVIIRFTRTGDLGVAIGPEAASEALAQLPNIQAALGYIVVEHDTGTGNLEVIKAVKFSDFDPGIQIQQDGADYAKRSILNFKGSEVVVNDAGDKIEITIGTDGAMSIVNDAGDAKITLVPKITTWVLESPDLTKWEIKPDNNGTLSATSGSTDPVTNIKVLRDDLTEVGFNITNEGVLQVIEPPPLLSDFDPEGLFVSSPDNQAWEVGVNNNNAIYLNSNPSLSNSLSICDDKDNVLFQVKEVANQALTYIKVISAADLPNMTPPPTVTGTIPEVFYDTGSGIRKIFFDTFDSTWKYIHDNSAV